MTPSAPLNVFQRLIRKWETVHPYNAAQAMELRGQADTERWQNAWDESLAAMGLGLPVVEDNHLRFQPLKTSQPVMVLPPEVTFEAHVSAGMNHPFGNGEMPFRPFIKQIDGSYFAGLVYQHWLADSVAVRLILREWFARVYEPQLARDRALRLADQGYWSHFGPHRIDWRMDHSAWSALRQFSRFRSVRRLKSGGSTDYSQAFIARGTTDGIVPRLTAFSRERGIKLNDLFLAAMMEQCARHLPFRTTRRRRDLALATIVDLRRTDRNNMDEIFGLFLGFTNVIVREGDIGDFDRLLGAIHRQNQLNRQTHAAAASTGWLTLSLLLSRGLAVGKSYHFYRKHMPLAGGISNVNLAHTWAGARHPDPILRYVRASPTGPMIPIAFTPTTLGDDLHIALTYRQAVLDARAAGLMMEGLIQRLDQCAKEAGRPTVP